MTDPLDPGTLPPVQQMILDVLAARYRLGETLWTFPTRVRPALTALEAKGLVMITHGITEKTVRASLTEAGRGIMLSESYWGQDRSHRRDRVGRPL